jgi:hypothetical protein
MITPIISMLITLKKISIMGTYAPINEATQDIKPTANHTEKLSLNNSKGLIIQLIPHDILQNRGSANNCGNGLPYSSVGGKFGGWPLGFCNDIGFCESLKLDMLILKNKVVQI